VIWPTAPITEGPLSADQATLVVQLAEAARLADGVAPLSEHVLLHVRHSPASIASPASPAGGARDLILVADGSVAGYAHLDADADDGADAVTSGELVVHPRYRRRRFGIALVRELIAAAGGRGIGLWAHGDLPAAAGLARTAGFTRVRALWQMRMPLASSVENPAFPAGVTIRTFRQGRDEEGWLEVNQRAFAHHPEQGAWTRQDLEFREAEPWFDPEGFFLAERDGALIGFHWTKVHQARDGGSPVGEVYVVGVDPGQQGGGLGRALTMAGLAHLSRLGLGEVMLYVDEDNTTAVRMYTGLGFSRWHADVVYRHP
jgi:mycothiol synthase